MYRMFAALPVDPDTGPGLKALQKGLSGASWRPERNFHITLRFFGDLTHELARDLDDLLGEIRAPEMELRLEGGRLVRQARAKRRLGAGARNR